MDEAVLLVACSVRPALDLIEQLSRLDELAAGCPFPTADGVMRALFQGPDAFRGDREHYGDPQNSFLDRVIERRCGIPITLSIVAIEVGRRLGVDLAGVGMPAHFLAAQVDPGSGHPQRWFDCFDGGRVLDEAGCRALYRQVSGGDERFDPAWLLPVSTRHIVIRVLTNLKAAAQRRGDLALLRTVMRLRLTLPELALAEGDEMARLMAPFN